MLRYYDPALLQPNLMNINGKYTPEEFALAFPFVEVPKVGDTFFSRADNENRIIAEVSDFSANEKAAWVILRFDKPFSFSFVKIAMFGPEPTEEEAAAHRAKILRLSIEGFDKALSDPERTRYDPKTFELFDQSGPEYANYMAAIATNRDNSVAELAALVEKYPELGTISKE